ncbi:MAG: hypothetical protein ACFFCW_48800, partial [Candidatus Hodarchaeota archaeon]
MCEIILNFKEINNIVMSGFLLDVGATITCPHGGQVLVISANTRVFINGQPVATQKDFFPIKGCPYFLTGTPHP